MNILLFRPKPHKETIGLQNVMICEPLELEYIAANIEPLGHSVTIIDMILEKKSVPYFVKKYKPDLVGITGYISHVNIMKQYAAEVKAVDSHIFTVVGGVHAEVNPEDLVCGQIDFIIRANGLKTFAEITQALAKKKSVAEIRSTIGGVYAEGKPYCEKEMQFPYRFPAREKVDRYRSAYYYMFYRNCSLIKTSFGCPYQCKFCFCRQVMDDKYFARSLENIADELEQIRETEIYIVDDDFLVNRERLLQFADILEKRGIQKKYLVYGRADFIAENEDVIARLKAVGLRAVIVGLESCDSKQLDNYNKKTNTRINEKAVAILRKYDVECYGTLILGLDWIKADFHALYKWIKKLGLVFVNLQPLTPLRGTELYESYRSEFIVREDEYEKWDLAHLVVKPTNISVRKYYWYTMLLYYKITANPKSGWYMVKKYGLHDTLKLSIGAMAVNHQYVKKLIGGK